MILRNKSFYYALILITSGILLEDELMITLDNYYNLGITYMFLFLIIGIGFMLLKFSIMLFYQDEINEMLGQLKVKIKFNRISYCV